MRASACQPINVPPVSVRRRFPSWSHRSSSAARSSEASGSVDEARTSASHYANTSAVDLAFSLYRTTHPPTNRFARISLPNRLLEMLAIGARDFHRPWCVGVRSRLQAAGSRWEAIYALNGSAFFHGSRDTSSCV